MVVYENIFLVVLSTENPELKKLFIDDHCKTVYRSVRSECSSCRVQHSECGFWVIRLKLMIMRMDHLVVNCTRNNVRKKEVNNLAFFNSLLYFELNQLTGPNQVFVKENKKKLEVRRMMSIFVRSIVLIYFYYVKKIQKNILFNQ